MNGEEVKLTSAMSQEGIAEAIPERIRIKWNHWSSYSPYYIRLVCATWGFVKYIFFFYLCWRQKCVLKKDRGIPVDLVNKLPEQTFVRARNYEIEIIHQEMIGCVAGLVYTYWSILYAGMTKVWFISGPFLDYLAIWPDDWDQETGESIVFIFLSIIMKYVVILPDTLWKTFYIEEKYGFNKMTWASFSLEWIKMLLMECILSIVTGIAILGIVRSTGQWFFLWVWLFCCFWVMLAVAIYPNFIAPIFNKYTPLREGRLRIRLRWLAHFIGFPLDEILVVHQNWRSEHRDAYFNGLLNAKRIVLTDTMLAGYPEADRTNAPAPQRVHHTRNLSLDGEVVEVRIPSRILHREQSRAVSRTALANREPGIVSRQNMYDTGFTEYEIEAVVAKLMGHWVHSHAMKEIIFAQGALFIFFVIFNIFYMNSSLFAAFEVTSKMDKPILLGLRLLLCDVMDFYLIIVANIRMYVIRRMEHQAYAFATRLGYGDDLIDAIIEMNKENLKYPYFDKWYWFFNNDEPSLLQRIAAIEEEMSRMEREREERLKKKVDPSANTATDQETVSKDSARDPKPDEESKKNK